MSRYRVKGVCARWYPVRVSLGVGVPPDEPRKCAKCWLPFEPASSWRGLRYEPLGFAMRVHVDGCPDVREVR